MTKKFRFMTGLLAVVLSFVMLSSVAYIAAEAGHDCTGADCAICHQINVCENLLKSIGLAGSAAAAVAMRSFSSMWAVRDGSGAAVQSWTYPWNRRTCPLSSSSFRSRRTVARDAPVTGWSCAGVAIRFRERYSNMRASRSA